MSKKFLNKVLSACNLAVMEAAHLRAYNDLYGTAVRGFRIPLTVATLVSNNFFNTFREKLDESLPSPEEIPHTPLLNWKPIEDRSLVKQTALDYRAEISSNKYAQAYRNELRGRVSVARGRTWWRLETMRQVRAANPDMFRGKVMEVGAGTGIVSATLSTFPEIEQMHCLDYDEYTVENLMPLVHHSLGADNSKLTRIVGSYNNLETADGAYDTVVAVGAMHHSEQLDATLAECFRVLRPGGHFIISDYAVTNDLSQEEYSMLFNKPISDQEAQKYRESGSLEGIRTNRSISEHARPLFVYQAAAFNAGFSVATYLFDATTLSGGYWRRLSRYRGTRRREADFYRQSQGKREHGYDRFGNVRSYSLNNPIYYPFYASHKPSLASLCLLGDLAGKPVYDNVVFVLKKPAGAKETFRFRYKTGKVYDLPSVAEAATESNAVSN